MSSKLIKSVAIARSGVYRYLKEELPNLGLESATPPSFATGLGVFNVYRPATTVARAAPLFVRLPVTNEHPNSMIDGANYRKLNIGFTGDSATVDMTPDKKEVTIRSSLTLIDNEGVRAYYSGIREVSPGYEAIFDWEQGVAPSGESYQIVMKEITAVNHLALTRRGRGGSAACILDTGVRMGRRSGLIYAVRKMLGVKDTAKPFTEQVDELIRDRAKFSDDEVSKRVDILRDSIVDLPESDGRAKLDRFVEDLARIKEESDESASEIVKIVNGLYSTLDAAAVEDVAYHTLVKGLGNTVASEEKEKHETTEVGEKEGKAEDEKPATEGESKKEEASGEKKEDEKKTKEEKGKEATEQPEIGEEKREEKEHKEADKFNFAHEKNETVDSYVDKIAEAVLAKLEAKNVKKEEPVMDSAIKRVMDSFKSPSSADKSPVKVDDSVKSTGVIANTMKALREGK